MRSRIQGLCLVLNYRRRRNSCLLGMLLLLLLLQATAYSFASEKKNKIISLELIPHHAQKARRLQQYDGMEPSSSSLAVQNNNSSSSSSSFIMTKEQLEEWRKHCPRFQLLDATAAAAAAAAAAQPQGLINRDLAATVTAQQVAALFQGYGTHYADLWCGTPPQRQTVIVDT